MSVNCYSEERATIETALQTCVDGEYPIQFDNTASIFGEDSTLSDSSGIDEWIRISIRGIDARKVEITNGRTRIFSEVILSIFVRENEGTQPLLTIADKVYFIFNNKNINGIQFLSTRKRDIPANNGWYQINLSTDYYWDRCET